MITEPWGKCQGPFQTPPFSPKADQEGLDWKSQIWVACALDPLRAGPAPARAPRLSDAVVLRPLNCPVSNGSISASARALLAELPVSRDRVLQNRSFSRASEGRPFESIA